jgi:hypothetical protein
MNQFLQIKVKRKIKRFSITTLLVLMSSACGVKKPPIPAYSFPMTGDGAVATSPTPGFNNPSVPLNESKQ